MSDTTAMPLENQSVGKNTGKTSVEEFFTSPNMLQVTCFTNITGLLVNASQMLLEDPKLRDIIIVQFVQGFRSLPVHETQFKEKCWPKATILLSPDIGNPKVPNSKIEIVVYTVKVVRRIPFWFL